MRSIQWRMALPRLRIAKTMLGTVASFRWFRFGWDVIASKHSFFIQIGRNKVKFLSCGTQQPLFLLSPAWKTIKRFRTVKIGTTVRPYDVAKYWRKHDALWSREVLRRKDGTTSRLASRLQPK